MIKTSSAYLNYIDLVTRSHIDHLLFHTASSGDDTGDKGNGSGIKYDTYLSEGQGRSLQVKEYVKTICNLSLIDWMG